MNSPEIRDLSMSRHKPGDVVIRDSVTDVPSSLLESTFTFFASYTECMIFFHGVVVQFRVKE